MSNSEDIVTRCPQCNTAFRVTFNQLAVADGQVRCGSCLAVFKAVDHDAETKNNVDATPPPQEKQQAEEQRLTGSSTAAAILEALSPKTKTSTTKKTASPSHQVKKASSTPRPKNQHQSPPKPLHQRKTTEVLLNDPNEMLINDDKDGGLDLDGDIFDFNSGNNNNKTSLFDRNLNEVKEHKRENADESWAVKMLAELEDEDKSANEKSHFISDPLGAHNTANQNEAKIEPSVNSSNNMAIDNEIANAIEQKIESKIKNEKDEALSSGYDEIDLNSITANEVEHEITKEVDDTSDSHSSLYTDNYDSFDPLADSSLDNQNKTHTHHEVIDTSDVSFHSSPNDDLANLGDAKAFDKQETIEELHSVSDDEIANAMSSRTHYQDEPHNYIANIEPAPVEMMGISSYSARRWLWRLAVIVTGLLLVVQVAIIRFDSLSKHPSYRPLYASACNIIGCSLPTLIDTQQIRTTNLIVRSHPQQQNALIIDAILINNAKFQQIFPALQLEFSDINNQLVASRQLQPDEYLRGELAGAKQMSNNQPIQLSIEIVDPGEAAVNYQLTVVQSIAQRQ